MGKASVKAETVLILTYGVGKPDKALTAALEPLEAT